MKSVQEYFCEYEQHHCNSYNKLTHYIGIPLILFGLIGLLSRVSFSVIDYRVDLAVVLGISALLLFYFRMHMVLGLCMLLCFSGCYYLGFFTHLYVLWGLFIFGWVLQFVGHIVFEKQKPSFFDNLIHLLVGPLWILNNFVKCVK